ncbi:hypothetical protein IPN35_00840 [Candidatus Peregrinibacteria bacterium]|nr:MAG: hypothetical protein IPN35_00840 [Candidatus Peregrinibacteria bacterium]
MKIRYFLFVGIFLFPSPLFAELLCEENDAICQCEEAWSDAFDAVTKHLSENDLTEFLSQNNVASADLWSGYRALSLRNRCFLESVCDLVLNPQEEQEEESSSLSPETALGGSSPGERTGCALGLSPSKTLSEISGFSEIEKRIRSSCGLQAEGKDSLIESRKRVLGMHELCREHQSVSIAIFDTTVRNLIHIDENRKTLGYLGKKISAILQELHDLVEKANTMISNINSSFDQLCTISHPDQK